MEAKVLFLLPLGVALLIPGPYQLQEFLKMLPRFISQLQRQVNRQGKKNEGISPFPFSLFFVLFSFCPLIAMISLQQKKNVKDWQVDPHHESWPWQILISNLLIIREKHKIKDRRHIKIFISNPAVHFLTIVSPQEQS